MGFEILVFQVLQGVQGAAVSPHQLRAAVAEYLVAHHVFQSLDHRVVAHGSSLHHDMFPNLGIPDFEYLVEAVLDHRVGQAGGDVRYVRPFAQGLLDFGIHEDRAAGSQVAGRLGQDGFLGELGGGEAQGVGKGLDERAAARRAGFVQLDPVQDPVLDEHGFHVLASDIEDEIHFRAYLLGGRVMRQRFHHRQV